MGAHVRDAACYVCWAFARAYAPQVMLPHVPRLCEGMLVTSLFDREINCRRAGGWVGGWVVGSHSFTSHQVISNQCTPPTASAAFQENVGRQGHQNFPHGIEILTAADYFTLGNRHTAYTAIALAVARFPPYRHPLIDHLAQAKLRHWDAAIRVLASQALARLTALAPAHVREMVAPSLLAQVDAVDLNRCVAAAAAWYSPPASAWGCAYNLKIHHFINRAIQAARRHSRAGRDFPGPRAAALVPPRPFGGCDRGRGAPHREGPPLPRPGRRAGPGRGLPPHRVHRPLRRAPPGQDAGMAR